MTTVKLKHNEDQAEFGIEHAAALLNYEYSKGFSNWELDDKNFEYKDGVIKRKNNKPDKDSKEQEGDRGGDIPSK